MVQQDPVTRDWCAKNGVEYKGKREVKYTADEQDKIAQAKDQGELPQNKYVDYPEGDRMGRKRALPPRTLKAKVDQVNQQWRNALPALKALNNNPAILHDSAFTDLVRSEQNMLTQSDLNNLETLINDLPAEWLDGDLTIPDGVPGQPDEARSKQERAFAERLTQMSAVLVAMGGLGEEIMHEEVG